VDNFEIDITNDVNDNVQKEDEYEETNNNTETKDEYEETNDFNYHIETNKLP